MVTHRSGRRVCAAQLYILSFYVCVGRLLGRFAADVASWVAHQWRFAEGYLLIEPRDGKPRWVPCCGLIQKIAG